LFADYLYEPGTRFCSAVTACEDTKFYRHVARLLLALLAVEHQAFEID
jgi:TorA maturation chaperone TorD